MVVILQFALGLRDRHRPRLQCHQEGRRGPEDVRRRGAAAATRAAAATAQGHAEGSAAADDAAAAGADGRAAAADPDGRRRSAGQIPPVAPPPPAAAAAAAQGAVRDRAPRATCGRCSALTTIRLRRSRHGEQGTAQASLTIGPDGRVVGCNVIRSTRQRRAGLGDLQHSAPPSASSLRRATATATPTTDTITTPPIVWRLEG